MNGGADRQAYDRTSTVFSPDGRLYQVEYAREAVRQGAPVVGVRTPGGVALAAHKPERSPLVESESVQKLHGVADGVAVASAGHAADARRLVDVARRAAQAERLRYGERAGVETLATTLADHVQEQTQSGGTRPYGTALLVAGHDGPTAGSGDLADPDGPADPGNQVGTDGSDGESRVEPRLFQVDPSGTALSWQATAVGRGADEITGRLEERYEPELTPAEGVELALSGLAAAVGDGLDPVSAAAGVVGPGGYRRLDPDELRERLAAVEDARD